MSLEDVDRLSDLPEDITSHMLSLMPTKLAVRTSVLSKRWRHCWTSVSNFNFVNVHPFKSKFRCIFFSKPDDIHPGHCSEPDSFSKCVDRLLESYMSSDVKLFRLHLCLDCGSNINVSKWIDKLVSLNIRELDLRAILVECPLSLFSCKTLTQLTLDCAHPDSCIWEPSTKPTHLPCLKTLGIVVYTNPLVNVFKLINGCPALETLSFEVINCKTVEDYIFRISTLKRLTVNVQGGSNEFFNRIVLRVPNLEYLFVDGMLSSLYVMEDVSSLVEASVSFLDVKDDYLWVELLKGLTNVKSLSADDLTCDDYDYAIPLLPAFLNLNHLELKGYFHPRLVPHILETSLDLEYLHIDEPKVYSPIEPNLVPAPACMLTSLTTIKFSNCMGKEHEIQFLEFVLGKGKVLKTLTISWKKIRTEEQMLLAAKVVNFPMASVGCEIHFL